jgi:hypothetical protein
MDMILFQLEVRIRSWAQAGARIGSACTIPSLAIAFPSVVGLKRECVTA